MNMMFKIKPVNKVLEITGVNIVFQIKPENKLLERTREHVVPE